MADDKDEPGKNLPAEMPKATGWLGELIANFNLPTFLAGPAGAAISRLIGGAADIPAAWLDQKAQAIKDRTKARTELNNAVTEQAIKEVQLDPDLRRRAAESLISREFRSQINKEAVAEKTVEILASSTTQNRSQDTATEMPAEPGADWMNAFERYVADASSDRLRDTWARVLAGEIQHPETFSLKTLRIVSEMDPEVARNFESAAIHVQSDLYIPGLENPVISLEAARELEDEGLITGTGVFGSTQSFEGNIALVYSNNLALVLNLDPGTNMSFPVWPLTRAGKEVLRITNRKNSEAAARIFAERLTKPGNLQAILLGQVIGKAGDGKVLIGSSTAIWSRGVG